MTLTKFVYDDEIHYGVELPNGDVLCGCCGGTFEPDDIIILETMKVDIEMVIKEIMEA